MMEVSRVVHRAWKEWDSLPISAKKKFKFMPIIGKYQYLYSNNDVTISLVKLNYNIGCRKKTHWEICGGGLQGIEKFHTKKDAEVKIKKLLGIKK